MRGTVFPFHRVRIDVPDFRCAFAQRGDDLLRRLRHHHRGSKQHAAAAGEIGEAERRGVADHDGDAPVVDAEQFGADVGDRRARAADIRMAGRDDDIAVLGDVDLRGGFAAGVEPEAGGDAPALQLAERRRVVRMRLRGFQRLDVADAREDRSVRGLGALLGGILQPQIQRIHLQPSASSSITHSTA